MSDGYILLYIIIAFIFFIGAGALYFKRKDAYILRTFKKGDAIRIKNVDAYEITFDAFEERFMYGNYHAHVKVRWDKDSKRVWDNYYNLDEVIVSYYPFKSAIENFKRKYEIKIGE